uniref:Uncharacterized protein n=1 Tax=Streptomyces avermitilis TaxID=33903 RepID=A0A499VRZ8_STRAX|nr:hypothetical protein SAVMC3_50300 [Streptomyces avermitilis]
MAGGVRRVPRTKFVHDRERGRRQGYGEQHAEDPGDRGPSRDGEHHHRRMHLHGPALDRRLEHMPFQNLHRGDHPERPQRDDEPPVGEGHQHRQRAGDEGAEVGDVRADEDQRAEADRARHAEDQQPDGDAHGVDERDERRAAHKALDGLEGPPGHRLDGVGGAARGERPQQPGGPVGVAQEEEHEQQGQYGHGDALADDTDAADDVGGGRPAELGEKFLRVGGQVVQRGPGGPEVGGDGLRRPLERGDDLVAGVEERGDDDVHGAADDGHDRDTGDAGGQRPVHADPDEPAVEGPEERGPQQREQHGYDGGAQLPAQLDPDPPDPGDEQDDGTPGRQPPGAFGE